MQPYLDETPAYKKLTKANLPASNGCEEENFVILSWSV